MKNRFLIIGSNSFSGAQFIMYLLQNDYEVVGISRSEEINAVYLPYKWEKLEGNFRFHQIDINHQLDELIDIMVDFKPEYIV